VLAVLDLAGALLVPLESIFAFELSVLLLLVPALASLPVFDFLAEPDWLPELAWFPFGSVILEAVSETPGQLRILLVINVFARKARLNRIELNRIAEDGSSDSKHVSRARVIGSLAKATHDVTSGRFRHVQTLEKDNNHPYHDNGSKETSDWSSDFE